MSKKDLKKIFIKSSPFPFDHSKLKEIDTVSVLANINTNDDLRKLELFFKNLNKNYPKTNFNNYLYLLYINIIPIIQMKIFWPYP